MEPQNNSDPSTPLSITPSEPIIPIETPATLDKIPSPSDPIVTASEVKLPPAPEPLTATEAISTENTSESPAPPTEAQLPPLSPPTNSFVPPIVPPAAYEAPPSAVSETTPPKKGSKLVLIGIILLIIFLAGYAFVTFSGLLSK